MSPRPPTAEDPDDHHATAAPETTEAALVARTIAPSTDHASADRIVDPRAVRIAPGPRAAHARVEPIVVEPPAVPLAPAPHITGTGILGGAAPADGLGQHTGDTGGMVIVNGEPTHLRLERSGPLHAVLADGLTDPVRTRVLLMPPDGPSATGPARGPGSGGSGVRRREVIVDGWLVDVEVESERRASLRERARRGREETAHGGPTEVHAIIPGRVVSVSVVAGEPVVAGQQLLVVEAMKMQNELRAPRDGVVSRVAVAVGQTIEVGDLMLVLA